MPEGQHYLALHRQAAVPLPDQENGDWYREQLYSYGLFGLLDGWIRRGYSETPQQMSDLITEIVRNH